MDKFQLQLMASSTKAAYKYMNLIELMDTTTALIKADRFYGNPETMQLIRLLIIEIERRQHEPIGTAPNGPEPATIPNPPATSKLHAFGTKIWNTLHF